MFGDGNLAKHSKYELLNPLKKLLDTLGYQSDKTEVTLLSVVVDVLTVIHKTEFERHSKISDNLKRVRNFILGQSKVKRIDIVCNWLKGSLRMQRAIEKPVERMNLIWIHQFHQKSRSFGHHQSIKKLLQQSFFITEAKDARKNIVLSGYIADSDGSSDGLEMMKD